MTDLLIKKMSIIARVVTLFIAAFLNIVAVVILCDWFPVDDPLAWTIIIMEWNDLNNAKRFRERSLSRF